MGKRLSSIDGGIDSITVDLDELARHVSAMKMAGDDNTVSTPYLRFTVWLSPCRLRGGYVFWKALKMIL